MKKRTSGTEFPKEHFSLQYKYAGRASEILGITIEQALMEFTQFWRRIHNPIALQANKMEWSFDSTTAQWKELCERIINNEPADVVAHDIYVRNDNSTEIGKKYFGCFRYDFNIQTANDCGVITIHFKNRDRSNEGPLSTARKQAREQELKLLFEWVKKNHRDAKIVQGGSWLYNLESYRRLFPIKFTADMKVEAVPFLRTSGIWGQFLNSEGKVREKMSGVFLDKVGKSKNKSELLDCFEFKILFPSTGIENFYSHFRIV